MVHDTKHPMILRRDLLTLLAAVLACASSGCRQPGSGGATARAETGAAGGTAPVVFRVGYGKGGNFNILRLRGTLEKRLAPLGVRVEWLNFPMGPQMMEAIGTGSLELGSCAATPPLFAQAAGYEFVYVANTPPGKSGNGGGILVPNGSPIRGVADLKGKRVAFQPGSVWQYLLVKALEREGLRYEDVRPVKMPPSEATAAFHARAIDAWVQGEPYITLVRQRNAGRVLASVSDIPTTGGFCVAAKDFAARRPDLIRAALEEVRAAGEWAARNPNEAARLTASTVGLDVPTLEKMIRERENTELLPVTPAVVARQQEQADLLLRLRILPRRVQVARAVLPPDENARLLPAAPVADRLARR
jgi:sulfonate transport system substrate-binding protein